jgi:2-polyprenyl-6-methoxyphenol hydroxylase-like FAD-dependent oxidoreductase
VRLADGIGLKDALLEAGAQGVLGFSVFGDGDSIRLPYGPDCGLGLGFDHGEMLGAFRAELLRRPGARVVRARAAGILREGGRVVGVSCDDGREFRAPLTVGADGRHSRTRDLLGIRTTSELISYSIAPAVDGDVLPTPGHGNVFLGGPGPILVYPYGRGRVRLLIDVPLGVSNGRDQLAAFVRERYAPFVPEPLRSAMVAVVQEGKLPGAANHDIGTESCAVSGAVLIGDAAGAAHPLTATGMTVALHDVATLVDCLASQGLNDRALLLYQGRRYRFARARAVFTHALYEVFRGHDAGPQALREGLFHYWRGSERARLVSMAILSGDDSSPATFLSEYFRVVGTSGWQALQSARRELQLGGAARSMVGMLATAGECLEVAADRALATLAIERSGELEPPERNTLRTRLTGAARWIPRRWSRPGSRRAPTPAAGRRFVE